MHTLCPIDIDNIVCQLKISAIIFKNFICISQKHLGLSMSRTGLVILPSCSYFPFQNIEPLPTNHSAAPTSSQAPMLTTSIYQVPLIYHLAKQCILALLCPSLALDFIYEEVPLPNSLSKSSLPANYFLHRNIISCMYIYVYLDINTFTDRTHHGLTI
jgi:hypothetical protein